MDTRAEIADLQGKASDVAAEIAAQLEAGASPDALVSRLRLQLELVDAVREKIDALAAAGSSEVDLETLRAGARNLAELSEANHRQATRKGIRLTPDRRNARPARPYPRKES